MTKEEFDIITNKIGCWFTHLKLNSFRKTFDGEVYPSSALGTDYDLFIHKLEKELLFEDNPSLPSNLDEAAEEASQSAYSEPTAAGFAKRSFFKRGFKAGAEWMAGQGVSWEDIMTYYEGFLLYGKDERAFTMEGNFNEGDKVIVQIRKK